MPTPRNSNYSAVSGGSIYAGLGGVPAWLASSSVNQVVTAANTSGAGGAPVNFFCGMAWRPDTKEIYIGAAGGHGDSGANRVVSIDLSVDNPGAAGWILRRADTLVGQLNLGQPTNLDDTPNSTHTYTWGNRWIPEQGRLMKFGSYAPYNTVNTFPTVHGFLPSGPSGGAWDTAATWAAPAAGFYGNAKRGANGGTGDVYAIWGSAGAKKWTATTGVWNDLTVTNLQTVNIYYPWAYNSAADYLFGLSNGDGAGAGSGVHAVKHTPGSPDRQDAITFNASAAYSAFTTAAEAYGSMDFNPVDGCFYWYAGTLIYKIIPNNTLVWDMAIYTPASGSFDSPAIISGSPVVVGRLMWAWFGSIGGFMHLAKAASNIQFLRMI